MEVIWEGSKSSQGQSQIKVKVPILAAKNAARMGHPAYLILSIIELRAYASGMAVRAGYLG
jgi:hypothetical protein